MPYIFYLRVFPTVRFVSKNCTNNKTDKHYSRSGHHAKYFIVLVCFRWTASGQSVRPDLFRFAQFLQTGRRAWSQFGRNLRFWNLLGQLGRLFVLALGYGLVQEVHDGHRLLRTTRRGWNALRSCILDIKTF